MNVQEYVWSLPNTQADWKTLDNILSNNVNNSDIISEDEYGVVSGIINNIINNDLTISQQLDDNIINPQNESSDIYFSTYNTYYMNNSVSNTSLDEILSDNFTVESNMKISWKYVDYVYAYYSSFTPDSRTLLNKYFGNKIYEIVKNKLENNIAALNVNSAFADKYHFSGGIAVNKHETLHSTDHTSIFDWRADSSVTKEYGETYSEGIYQNTVKYHDDKYQTNITHRYHKKHKYDMGTIVDTILANSSNYKETYDVGTLGVSSASLTKTTTNSNVSVNSKYTSVDNWLSSFSPIMIKYRID